ncbi:formyltransferase family protein [Kitasatospora sp. NPDC052896]|uniref:formyltransferase family protein n=1 Tax=Kitasatospora sp. NPDC052896 TaxID=3364061 RepID=UPI0037C64E81
MRITVCASQDLPACLALNRLVPALSGHHVQVLLSHLAPPPETAHGPLARLRAFERDVPNEVLFPALDRAPEPSGRTLTFHHLSRRHGFPLHPVRQINAGDGLGLLESFHPDLVVAIRFGHPFRAPALRVPQLGTVQLHAGELPRHAGPFGPFRALLEGASSLGCPVHLVDGERVDSGPLLAMPRLPVDQRHSLAWHVVHAYPLGVQALLECLGRMAAGELLPVRPQYGPRHLQGLPGDVELADFSERGWRLVDPSDYADFLRPFASPDPEPHATPSGYGPAAPATATEALG